MLLLTFWFLLRWLGYLQNFLTNIVVEVCIYSNAIYFLESGGLEKICPINEQTRVNFAFTQKRTELKIRPLTFLKVDGQLPQACVPKDLCLCKLDKTKMASDGPSPSTLESSNISLL